MAPALQGTSYENGDRILLEKVTGWVRAPKRWEIYHYYDPDGNPVAKRVVGLPDEKISVKDHRIFINGVELQWPEGLKPVKYYGYGNLANNREVNCGNDYFMLGDDSIDSHDSRYTGPIARSKFRGRAWCVLWPYSHVGLTR
jgi:signal peptidase I